MQLQATQGKPVDQDADKEFMGADVSSSGAACVALVTVNQWECSRSSVPSETVL